MTGPVRRVLHVTWSLSFGGVERQLQLIAQTATARYRHEFLALGRSGEAAERIAEAGSPVTAWSMREEQRLRLTQRLFRTLRRTRPNVVHCHGLEGNLFGLPAAWLAGIPVRVGEEVGVPEHGPPTKLALAVVYRMAQRVVGVSDAVTNWLVESGEVPWRKAVRIYNPVILPTVTAGPRLPDAPFRIAFVGRLEPVKNAGALIEAVAYLAAEGLKCELHVVGDGSERETLEQRAIGLGASDHIRFHGFMSDPSSVLADVQLYVQPSLSEGFGIALVEAMGCGLPAVASRRGGMPEIVTHGVNGWLVEPPTSKTLTSTIRAAAGLRPAELAKMGRDARSSVQGRFTPEIYVAQIEQLYDDLLAGRSADV